LQAGDSALLVVFGDVLTTAINLAAHAFDHAINAAGWPGIEETTPVIRGVLVRYDPLTEGADAMRSRLGSLLQERDWLQSGPMTSRQRWQLPACYGGEHGPDLEQVATAMGVSIEQAIQEHSNTPVRVLMLGFSPGCAYLGSLPERWDLPRLDYVKPQVPPGSLSVAIRQTVLFATSTPTGWQTIARTPFLSFSRHREPTFPIAAGDEVTFRPIDADTFADLQRAVERGESIVEPESVQ